MNPDALIAFKNPDTSPCVKVSENNPRFSPIPLMVLGFKSDTAAVSNCVRIRVDGATNHPQKIFSASFSVPCCLVCLACVGVYRKWVFSGLC